MVMRQMLDILELQSARAAMKLMENVAAWSRTPTAGKLRMLAVQYVLFGKPTEGSRERDPEPDHIGCCTPLAAAEKSASDVRAVAQTRTLRKSVLHSPGLH